jgi:hypothetical protein
VESDQQEIQALSQRIVAKAAHKLGGVAALSKLLGVGDASLGDWIQGRNVPPPEVILRVVSLLVDEPTTFWREPPPPRDAIADERTS